MSEKTPDVKKIPMSRRVRFAIGGGVIALVVAGALLGWADTTRTHLPAFGDVPTWIAGVAASIGVPAVLYQFIAQRRQLAEQQKTIAAEFTRQRKRDELLDVQLAEARRGVVLLERQHAERVDLDFRTTATPPPGVAETPGGFPLVVVTNGAKRPIRDVVCQLELNPGQVVTADAVMEMYESDFGSGQLGRNERRDQRQGIVKPGQAYGFLFGHSAKRYPGARMSVTFTDDAGVQWRIDHDLHLERLPDEGE